MRGRRMDREQHRNPYAAYRKRDATANDHVYSVQISANLAVGNLQAADTQTVAGLLRQSFLQTLSKVGHLRESWSVQDLPREQCLGK